MTYGVHHLIHQVSITDAGLIYAYLLLLLHRDNDIVNNRSALTDELKTVDCRSVIPPCVSCQLFSLDAVGVLGFLDISEHHKYSEAPSADREEPDIALNES